VKQKTLILVTGPTASGKTSRALALARQHHTAIISADSRQCFRELNIGVAKPAENELHEIRHYFINSHSIHDAVTAITFARYATTALDEIFATRDVAIMAGGTGLYIKAFLEGFDDIPEIPASIREKIRQEFNSKGFEWLQNEIRINDPVFFQQGEIMNPQRMMRALEVKLATGKSIKEFQTASSLKKDPGFLLEHITMELPREQLYRNINERVNRMIEQGLVEEARALIPFRHLNALQTVGYTELFDYFDGQYTLDEAVEKIRQNTRRYAKRQLTWNKKYLVF
jgi:tRNA dimethylallyltransferase